MLGASAVKNNKLQLMPCCACLFSDSTYNVLLSRNLYGVNLIWSQAKRSVTQMHKLATIC
jgi:hypothetical protein